MKKPKVLVLTLAAALMVMGGAYAATWSDTVNINTTAKTGHVDMYFDANGAQLGLPNFVNGAVSYANHNGADEQNRRDIANVTFSNLYPGAKESVTLKIMNNSTIPVTMRAITDTRSDNWGPNGENFNQIGASVRFFDKDGNALQFDNSTTYANPWEPAHLAGVQLPVGGYATMSFTFQASDTIDEDATFTFSPSAVFEQFNNDGAGNVTVVAP